jgi:glycerol-3-phosphate acyltransferase PlsY
MREAAALVAAYLLGAIPFGLLIGKARGIDLRTVGSGNIGATNAMRALGRPLGLSVFALDALKGFAPAWAALHGFPGLPQGHAWAAGVGFASVLGHSFPVWLSFKGGKGVATGCGVWLALAPLACAAALLTWLLVLGVTRYVALASTLAALSVPLALRAQGALPGWLVPCALAMGALVALRHRGNFVRMAAGVEPRALARRQEGSP